MGPESPDKIGYIGWSQITKTVRALTTESWRMIYTVRDVIPVSLWEVRIMD